MLPIMFKHNSRGLLEAAKTLCKWTFKDVNIVCNFRLYHNGTQFPFKMPVLLMKASGPFRITKLQCGTRAASLPLEYIKTEQPESSVVLHDSAEYFKEHDINVLGKNVPPPILSIEEANFPNYIQNILKQHNIVTPTVIQSVAWSAALAGRDFVGISPTGSGKTLAYAIPGVLRVKQLQSETTSSVRHPCPAAPFGLVLTPTRELAQQIQEVMKWFENQSLRCVAAYGGLKKWDQVRNLGKGVEILIATPGRCNDLLNSQDLILDRCSYLVLDEADRMLDMGFLNQIEPIIEEMPVHRQNLMWSATWPEEVREIAKKFLSNYIRISVGSIDLRPKKNIRQTVVMCSSHTEKYQKFFEYLSHALESPESKVLIFAEKKMDVEKLEYQLRSKGLHGQGIHGDKKQTVRETALSKFRNGRIKILVATAVAARGLDIDDITHVVNFDCPKSSDEYIHKIGRTGRMEKKGEAITYVTEDDVSAGYLVEMLRETGQTIPEELHRFLAYKRGRFGSAGSNFRRRDAKMSVTIRNRLSVRVAALDLAQLSTVAFHRSLIVPIVGTKEALGGAGVIPIMYAKFCWKGLFVTADAELSWEFFRRSG